MCTVFLIRAQFYTGGDDMSNLVNLKVDHILSVDLKTSTESYVDTNDNCDHGIKEGKKSFWKPNKSMQQSSHALIIHYVRKIKGTEEWRIDSLILEHDGFPVLNGWFTNMQAILASKLYIKLYVLNIRLISHKDENLRILCFSPPDFINRPKNFLFFINPYGGKGKGPQIFSKYVKPVLEISRVKYTIVTTERRNHIEDYIKEMKETDLTSYDVLVAVGGDGSIREVVSYFIQDTILQFRRALTILMTHDCMIS